MSQLSSILKKKDHPRSSSGSSMKRSVRSLFLKDKLVQSKKKSISQPTVRVQPVRIFDEGVDVTPKPLVQARTYADEKRISMADIFSTPSRSMLQSLSSDAFQTRTPTKSRSTSMGLSSVIRTETPELLDENSFLESSKASTISLDRNISPKTVPKVQSQVPRYSKVTIILRETDTVLLLDIDSLIINPESEYYKDMLRKKRLRERMLRGEIPKSGTVDQEVQTFDNSLRTKSSLAPLPKTRNVSTQASAWEFYLAYKSLDKQLPPQDRLFPETSGKAKRPRKSENVIGLPETMPTEPTDKKKTSRIASLQIKLEKRAALVTTEKVTATSNEKTFDRIARNPRFRHALMVIERILAASEYIDKQTIFEGMTDNIKAEDYEYKYYPDLLWTFQTKKLNNFTVTSMSWNPADQRILGVGYGKFQYAEEKKGVVCCWSVKNPETPERSYNMESAVTVVRWSEDHPGVLAAGCHDGYVALLNIGQRDKHILVDSYQSKIRHYSPVWQIQWYHNEDYAEGVEQLVTIGDDGLVLNWESFQEFSGTPMIRLSRLHSKVKGVQPRKKETKVDILIARYASLLTYEKSPLNETIYYLGTDEGCIYKCSMNELDRYSDVFMAHTAAIYAMHFSPFCNRIFMTCGADWYVRVWVEGIAEPVISLSTGMSPVLAAVWSPTHANIIASLADDNINIWDLKMKTHVPMSVTQSPHKFPLTALQFSGTGKNIVAGDMSGNILTYNLIGMPAAPFLQENALVQGIKNALITKPELWKQLKKTGHPFR